MDYFRDRIRPELSEAVILGRAKTVEEAIDIATDYERDRLKRGLTTSITRISSVVPSPTYASTSSGASSVSEAAQNYQKASGKKEVRKCYRCKKTGHLKKDCKVKLKEHASNVQHVTEGNMTLQRETNVRTEPEYEEPNIFSHFIDCNNQGCTPSTETQNTSNRLRFYIPIKTAEGHETKAMVDTGSTTNTIREDTCEELGLQTFACKPMTIRYGNLGTEVARRKAVLHFDFNQGDSSTGYLLVVPKQNEGIILGMDWMIEEDVVLFPRNSSVKKMAIHQVNDSEVVEDLLQRYPRLTEDIGY